MSESSKPAATAVEGLGARSETLSAIRGRLRAIARRPWATRHPRAWKTIAGLAVGLTLTAQLWLPLLGQFLVVADPLAPADVVVPLGGGFDRALGGASVFKQGYGQQLVLLDMWLGTPGSEGTYALLARTLMERQGIPAGRIVMAPGTVGSTFEEALTVRQMADRAQWGSAIIVTAAPHTRRTRIIFRDMFADSSTTLIVRPVGVMWYEADYWWLHPSMWRETMLEYLKLGAYMLGYHRIWTR